VGDMAANRTKQINMTTMGLVAWYFGVTTIDDLIRYDPRAPARQESDTDQTDDLEQLARSPAPAEAPDELPDLRRQAPPQAPPAPGSIVVINRIPAALASVHHGEIAALTGQQQTNISRMVSRPLQRIARATLAVLLDALELDRVSDLIEVHLDLSATSSGIAVPPDAVRVDVAPFPAWK